jgi:hypothetical protein
MSSIQPIDYAVSQGEDCADALGVKIVLAYEGAFFKSWHIEAQKELYADGRKL